MTLTTAPTPVTVQKTAKVYGIILQGLSLYWKLPLCSSTPHVQFFICYVERMITVLYRTLPLSMQVNILGPQLK